MPQDLTISQKMQKRVPMRPRFLLFSRLTFSPVIIPPKFFDW